MSKGSGIWHVYMVRCSDWTLYTGITNDLEKRIEAHNSGKEGARYTRFPKAGKAGLFKTGRVKISCCQIRVPIKKTAAFKKDQVDKR